MRCAVRELLRKGKLMIRSSGRETENEKEKKRKPEQREFESKITRSARSLSR